MSIKSPSAPASNRAFLLASLLLSLFWAITAPVWLPAFMHDNDLDFAWSIALDHAHTHGLAFGGDIVFTYGPLGYLCTHAYIPSGFPLAILLRILVGIWCAFAASRLAFSSPSTPQRWLGLALLAIAPFPGPLYDPFIWMLPALLLLLDLDTPRQSTRPNQLLCTLGLALLAILSLGKFTTFMMAVPVLFALTANRAHFHRKRLWEPCIFPLALLTAFVLSGQSLTSFPAYFYGAIQASLAHSSGNGFPFPVADVLGPIAALLTLTLWLWLSMTAFSTTPGTPPPRASRIITALAGAGLAFIAYKAGIVRAGPGTMSTIAYLLIITALAITLSPPATGPRKAFLPACAALALALFAAMVHYVAEPGWLTRVATTPYSRARAICFLVRQPDLYQSIHQNLTAELIQKYPLPPEFQGKTTDLIDLHQMLPIIWNVRYTPRPTLQDYPACSPYLSGLNKAFYQGPNAPEQVFFSDGQIDMRYPLLAQGPTVLALLSHYQPHSTLAQYTILQKAPTPTPLTLEPLAELDIQPGQPVQLPGGPGLIWAQLDYRPSLTGRLANLLHRSPRLILAADLPDGLSLKATGTLGQAASGFLISPACSDPMLNQLWTPDAPTLATWRVNTFTLSWDSDELYAGLFNAPMKLKLYRIKR